MNFVKKIIGKTVLYDLLAIKWSVLRNKKRQKYLNDITDRQIKNYVSYYKHQPDLENPKKFSEIILWQKLYFHDERATIMTDKLLCKDYFKEMFGDDLQFAKVLGSFDTADKIDFRKLPEEFVLKCNHNTGYIFHVKKMENEKYLITNLKDKTHKKFSIRTTKKILNGLLKINFYYFYFEWNYKDIKPMIFAEQFLGDSDLVEYKMYMNDGKLIAFHITSNRQTDERNDFFDANLKNMDVWADVPPSDVPPALPDNIDKLIEIAKKISVGFPSIRVDLYNHQGKIFFGEATFFHMGGYLEFKHPENLDELLGKDIIIRDSFKNNKM